MKKNTFFKSLALVAILIKGTPAFASSSGDVGMIIGGTIGSLILPFIMYFVFKKSKVMIIARNAGILFIIISIFAFYTIINGDDSIDRLIAGIINLLAGIYFLSIKKNEQN